MKKICFSLFAFILLYSCEKTNDEKTFSKEQLYGKWEAIEESSLGYTQQLEITENDLYEIRITGIGIPLRFKASYYSFNGKNLKYSILGLEFEFTVKDVTNERLLLGYHEPLEYYRVSD